MNRRQMRERLAGMEVAVDVLTDALTAACDDDAARPVVARCLAAAIRDHARDERLRGHRR